MLTKRLTLLFFVLSLTLLSCGEFPNSALSSSGLEKGASYFLIAKHSGLHLDVPGSRSDNGLALQQYTPNGTAAQQFVLEEAGNGTWRLVNKASGKALEINDGTKTEGSFVQQWDRANVPWQLWSLIDKGNGYYLIRNAHTGLVMDVAEVSNSSGAKVWQWKEHGRDNQLWKLSKVGSSLPQPEPRPEEPQPEEEPETPVPTETAANSVQTIIDDMTLPHEAKLHGVPDSYNWSAGPRLGMGNRPVGKNGVLFRAIHGWGEVYEAASGNPASNSRVQLKDIRTYILSKRTNTWQRVQASSAVEGAAFREDYQGNANRTADIRLEATGGISVTAGDGHNFHFWPQGGRATINPDDIQGVFTTIQARLVLNDPNGPDDRQEARYLVGMGADYWLSLTATWQSDWSANADVGVGRHKFVRSGWQSFNMTSLSPEELRRNPPPLE